MRPCHVKTRVCSLFISLFSLFLPTRRAAAGATVGWMLVGALIAALSASAAAQTPGTTVADHDAGNKLINRRPATGAPTAYEYDAAGNLTRVVVCRMGATPGAATFPASGGQGSVTVAAPSANCPWAATSSAPWLTVVGAGSGVGSGTVGYRVAAYTVPDITRVATLTIGDAQHQVTQLPAAGVNAQVSVTAGTPTVAPLPPNSAGYLDEVTIPYTLTNLGSTPLYAPVYFQVVELSKPGADLDPTRPYRLASADDFTAEPISGGLVGSVQTLPVTVVPPGGAHTGTWRIWRGVAQRFRFLVNVYASAAPPSGQRGGAPGDGRARPAAGLEMTLDVPAAR